MINVFEDFASRQPGGGALTVTRRALAVPAYDAQGYQLPVASSSTITIVAQVTPTSGRNLQVLADQGITAESHTLWTATKLLTRDSGHPPDTVTGVDLDGDTWTACNWKQFHAPDGDVFYQVVVVRGALE